MFPYRKHLSKIIKPAAILLVPVAAMGYAGCGGGTLGPGGIADPCFDGLYTQGFADGSVDLDVRVPSRSMVHFMGWHSRPERTVPWSNISFEGEVKEMGRANGELTVNFSLDDGSFVERDAGEHQVFLPGAGDCASRDTLELRLSYRDLDDMMQVEVYELTRVPE